MSNKFAAACLVSLFWLAGCTKAQPPETSAQKPPIPENMEVAEIAPPAYAKYRKIGLKGAPNLLATGW
ncbi:MAG TPA: hypothetical protein VGC97_01150 [Pyrinomonadaceae bacterium]|jgi:hypothetical protein